MSAYTQLQCQLPTHLYSHLRHTADKEGITVQEQLTKVLMRDISPSVAAFRLICELRDEVIVQEQLIRKVLVDPNASEILLAAIDAVTGKDEKAVRDRVMTKLKCVIKPLEAEEPPVNELENNDE